MLFFAAGGFKGIDILFDTWHGISVINLHAYTIYYFMVALMVFMPLTMGKRAFCHTVCWMAPFMVTGRGIKNLAPWPGMNLISDQGRCSSCGRCNDSCPMSLDVKALVQRGSMHHPECILCCACVDTCPRGAVNLSFSKTRL